MKNLKIKILFILFLTIIISIISHTAIYAAGINMSISKSSGYVGDTFSVTISGINGIVDIGANQNISISPSGRQFVDGSLTITGNAISVGTGTITVTPEDVTTTDAEPVEITTSASRSITIKEKEVEVPKEEVSESKNTSKTTTSKTTTSKSNQSKTNNNEQKENLKKSEDFYITKLVLNGVTEEEEYVEIELTPEFSKDIYEYECKISSNIERIEIQKDAGEFTDSIVITGIDEIKEGENLIKVELIEEGYETKTYIIKAIKEENNELDEVEENVEPIEEKQTTIISMPLYVLIIMDTLIIIIEAFLMYFLDKKFKQKNTENH